MKKTTTNRRKKLPLLLGALLIVSVAAYGTRAYFSDSATQQGDIKLELGTVKIAPVNEKNWRYIDVKNGENLDIVHSANTNLKTKNSSTIIASAGEIDKDQTLVNVRPGDSFTRDYEFTNNGTLDVKLDLKSELSSEGSPFVTTIDDLNAGGILTPGNSAKYTVTIKVDPHNVDNKHNIKSNIDADKIAVDYLTAALTVKAVQTNAQDIGSVNP